MYPVAGKNAADLPSFIGDDTLLWRAGEAKIGSTGREL